MLTTRQNAIGNVPIVAASAGLTTHAPKPGEPALAAGETDPHFWLDPVLVKTYVANIGGVQEGRPGRGGGLRGQRGRLRQEALTPSDAWIRQQVAQVPAADRKLVMNHASHGYFADRYGFRIVGTVIPSASTSRHRRPASSSTSPGPSGTPGSKRSSLRPATTLQLAQQIGAETGVKVVTDLLDHSLTAPDGPAPTYLDMMKYDTRLIVEALK